MANDLSAIIPKIVAGGLLALRRFTTLPALINTNYSTEAAGKGDTINVPLPVALPAIDVTPAATPPAGNDITPTTVAIQLNKWRQSTPFHLTDKDLHEVEQRSVLPMQASEAIAGLAEDLNANIFAEYKGVYGYVGTAATTPFASDLTAATNARKTLNNQKAGLQDRRIVLNPDAMANALGNRAIQDASFRRQGEDTVRTGVIGEILGFTWVEDQQVPSHTAGTASGATTNNAGYAVGAKTVTLASAGTGTILVGDVITFAGDTQTYTVTTGDADVSNGGTVSFEPGLVVAIPTSNTAITLKATHVVNLAFQRAAFALAMRPLADMTVEGAPAAFIQSAVDPVSGLTLRLEVTRQHKRWAWAFDILYGVKLVRPALAVRVAG